MSVLRVKNWAEFQHYAKRRPPWIKLHHSLLDDYAWHRLPEASKALGPMLWLLASERVDGAVPYDLETIAFRLHMTRDKVDAALGPLIGAGFMIEQHDAGAPLAACQQPASSERETEKESKTERERDTRAHQAPTKVPEAIAAAARARGSGTSLAQPIPEDWQPGEGDVAWAAKARPDLTPALLAAETERFRNHAIGNNRLAHDWGHLWRNWAMKAALDAPPAVGRRPGNGTAPMHIPSVRMGGPDSLWKMRLTGYRPGDPWKYEGDPPGGANCKVPAELIPHWRAYLSELESIA
jgi:hypothetical protein